MKKISNRVALLPLFTLVFFVVTAVEARTVSARGALTEAERTNIKIFKQSSPSVVYITRITDTIDLFTRDITRIPKGTGSGFVWDDKGHIITNYHVVKGAAEVRVRLSDHRTFNAKFIGASPDHDIAVLKIPQVKNMPVPLPIGTSEDLQVGQNTYAIGNPFGLDQTLTTGVVSALDRSLNNSNGSVIKGLIQTDAAINPGNSGGPLLDSSGRLIGINTAIYSPSGAYAGIGLAVPVDKVNRVVPQLIKNGRYQRPRLGITIDGQINKMITSEKGVKGVVVIDVEYGSPAYKAGLKGSTINYRNDLVAGDVILSIDGHTIKDIHDLLDRLEEYSTGDTIKLKYLRGKKKKTVSVTL